jgi:hypothetical protein
MFWNSEEGISLRAEIHYKDTAILQSCNVEMAVFRKYLNSCQII